MVGGLGYWTCPARGVTEPEDLEDRLCLFLIQSGNPAGFQISFRNPLIISDDNGEYCRLPDFLQESLHISLMKSGNPAGFHIYPGLPLYSPYKM